MEANQKRNIILLTVSHMEDMMLSLQETEIDNSKYTHAHWNRDQNGWPKLEESNGEKLKFSPLEAKTKQATGGYT